MHPFVLWRKGELSTIKGDRISIGSASNGFRYTNHRLKLEKGDGIYLFTDGFVDQFGGERGKKYKSTHFRELLHRMGKYPIDQQRNMMIREFENWKGIRDQVDDVLVMGTVL
jgi:serine phosphatase RsbU (regulator of sigma subunit)